MEKQGLTDSMFWKTGLLYMSTLTGVFLEAQFEQEMNRNNEGNIWPTFLATKDT